jgi:hypothetical protein
MLGTHRKHLTRALVTGSATVLLALAGSGVAMAGELPVNPECPGPRCAPSGDQGVRPSGDHSARPSGDQGVRPSGDQGVRPSGDGHRAFGSVPRP